MRSGNSSSVVSPESMVITSGSSLTSSLTLRDDSRVRLSRDVVFSVLSLERRPEEEGAPNASFLDGGLPAGETAG